MKSPVLLFVLFFILADYSSGLCWTVGPEHWNTLPPSGWIEGAGTHALDSTTDTFDPASALRFRYPINYVGGSGTEGVLQYDYTDSNELYVGHWFKYSSGFFWHNINNKIDAIVLQAGVVANCVIGVWGNTQPQPRTINVTPQPDSGTCTSVNIHSNTGYDPTIVDNKWYWIEVRTKINNAPSSDGILQVWLDGQLVIDRTDICYTNTPSTLFGFFNHSPIWGGGVQSGRTQDDYLWIDYTVISTSPINYPGGIGFTRSKPPRKRISEAFK